MYFVFHIKKTEIQILLILILNNFYLVENFLLGANEKQYLIDYLDTNCAPINNSVCSTLNITSASIGHECVDEEQFCSGIIISRESTCEKCKWFLCDDQTICTNEESLCDGVINTDCITNNIHTSNCSERGTLSQSLNGKCICKHGFTGKQCNECSKPEDINRKYLCCRIDLYGLKWGLLCPKLDQLENFMNGNYENAQKCFFQNEITLSLNGIGCDCQFNNNSLQRDIVNPVWLSDLISSGNKFKLPINNNEEDSEEDEDSIQGVIAFSFALLVIIISCYYILAVCFIVQRQTRVPQK